MRRRAPTAMRMTAVRESWTTVLGTALALALWLSCLPVASAPRSPAEARVPGAALLDEVQRTFTVRGQPIPPEIFRDLGDGNIADSGRIWVTVDVDAATGSNLYADLVKIEGQWVTQTKLNDKTVNGSEQTAYRFIGTTHNRLVVAITSYNGGGSGTFYNLHILDATLGRAFDEDGKVVLRVFLTGIQSLVLGDRWAGDVSISGNVLTITTTGHGPAERRGGAAERKLQAQRP